MPSIEYICPTCGTHFSVDYDYVIPGVSGFVIGYDGQKTFGDPDTPMHCSKCMDEMLANLKGEKNMRPIIITIVDGKIAMTPEEFKKHMDDAYSQGYSDASTITSTYGTTGSNWWQRLDVTYCNDTATATNASVKTDA